MLAIHGARTKGPRLTRVKPTLLQFTWYSVSPILLAETASLNGQCIMPLSWILQYRVTRHSNVIRHKPNTWQSESEYSIILSVWLKVTSISYFGSISINDTARPLHRPLAKLITHVEYEEA